MGGIFGGSKKPKNAKGSVVVKNDAAQNVSYPEFKLLMIGDPGVGKSSLLLRYADNEFTDNFISTIGVDYKEMKVDVNGVKVTLQIWDTAGEERFRTITSSYYRGAHGMILTFDLTNPATFKSCPKWIQEVDRYAEDDVVLFLAGNKCDLADKKEVNDTEITQLKEKHNMEYLETSAKNGDNVKQMFQRLAEQVVEKYHDYHL